MQQIWGMTSKQKKDASSENEQFHPYESPPFGGKWSSKPKVMAGSILAWEGWQKLYVNPNQHKITLLFQ